MKVKKMMSVNREKGHLVQTKYSHFIWSVANKLARTLVPNIDFTLRVNSKDGSVGCVNQFGVLPLLGNTTCDILSDADHP